MTPISDAKASFACFVTGTDTEIGKTLVAAALVHGLAKQGVRVAAMKPVAAGTQQIDGRRCNEDVEILLSQVNTELDRNQVVPYLFDEPVAPHIAARNAGVTMTSRVILKAFAQLQLQAQAVVVEGAGGFCVPISETEDLADVAQALALPVVLVVGMRLGCISHAVLTAQAVQARGLRLVGWVANTVDPDMPCFNENIQALNGRLPAPYLGCIPRLVDPDPAIAARHLDFSRLEGWPCAMPVPE
ncbi:MAG: dethiobiotin synthase [Pusillimonas sp.]